jgi:uncharacterized membrane protein
MGGVAVDVRPVEVFLPDAAIGGLAAPPEVRQGEPVEVRLDVLSPAGQAGTVRLTARRGGEATGAAAAGAGGEQMLAEVPVRLEPGANPVAVAATLPPGEWALHARLEVDGDPQPANDEGWGFTVVGGPARVLLAEGREGEAAPLRRALEGAGMRVEALRPAGAGTDAIRAARTAGLGRYDAIVLAGVPAGDLPRDLQEALRRSVAEHGAGLVVLGGAGAADAAGAAVPGGYGGYAEYGGTPLGEALPIAAAVREGPDAGGGGGASANGAAARPAGFIARVVSQGAAVRGLTGTELPPLYGYARATARPGAETVLASDTGDPILAQWQYGLGRVVAWTSDPGGTWSGAWTGTAAFDRLWTQAVRWAMPSPLASGPVVTARDEGDGYVSVRVVALGSGETDALASHAEGTIVSPDGLQGHVRLPQVAPGRYEGRFRPAGPGVYFVRVELTRRQGGAVARRSTGFVVPPAREQQVAGAGRVWAESTCLSSVCATEGHRIVVGDRGLLEGLARESGGRVVGRPEEAWRRGGRAAGGPQDVWDYALGAALALFVADVAARRLGRPDGKRDGRPAAEVVAPGAVAPGIRRAASGEPGEAVGLADHEVHQTGLVDDLRRGPNGRPGGADGPPDIAEEARGGQLDGAALGPSDEVVEESGALDDARDALGVGQDGSGAPDDLAEGRVGRPRRNALRRQLEREGALAPRGHR